MHARKPRKGTKPPGRKSGSFNKRTHALRALTDKVLNDGDKPLEVMLANMRYYHREQIKLLDEIKAGLPTRVPKKIAQLLEQLHDADGVRMKAQSCAMDAAPYCHPKLASIEHKGPRGPIELITGQMTLEQMARAYGETVKTL